MRWLPIIAIPLVLASCATSPPAPPDARAELAPTGTLRAGINYTNAIIAYRDMFTGELGGVSVDLVRELARRLDVRVVLVGFDFSGSLADALASGVLDIGGIARGSGRKGTLDFSPGYLQIETTDDRFLVVEQTLAIPKGREAGLRYLREFIEEMKASGFVKRALVRSGNPHVLVAPPESK